VRNGQRWLVTHINPESNRCAARRLDDNTIGVFPNDYIREHVTHGYAVTVHSVQGATAHTTHAILSGENATRALAYVALTRGRETNAAYLYERATEPEHRHDSAGIAHIANRGTAQYGASLLRTIVANDQRWPTAHEQATETPAESLDAAPRGAAEHRAVAVRRRKIMFQRWSAND
jgi:ATP-dependent exoDNAse (exonuclease V) alpha subunit